MKEECVDQNPPQSPSRRKFLSQVGVTSVATIAVLGTNRSVALATAGAGQQTQADREDHDHGENNRSEECLRIRKDAAQADFRATPPNLQHPTNHDETHYPNKAGNYSKGLPHNSDGTVQVSAFQAMVKALNSEKPADFNQIPLGGNRKLTNPQAGIAFDMEGADSHALVQPPAPAFASKEEAAEIAENYWMALLRDVPFGNYASHLTAAAAATDLTNFGADFKGPKNGSGAVTPQLLFRGLTAGDRVGP